MHQFSYGLCLILVSVLAVACRQQDASAGGPTGINAGAGRSTVSRDELYSRFDPVQPTPQLKPFLDSEAHLFALSPPAGAVDRGWADLLLTAQDDQQAAISLLEQGRVDPASEILPGYGLLQLAVKFGLVELGAYLLDEPAAAGSLDQAELNELLATAVGHADTRMIELLGKHGARIPLSAGYVFRSIGFGAGPDRELLAFLLEHSVISDVSQDWCAVLANALPLMSSAQLADQIERNRELRMQQAPAGTEAEADARYTGNSQTYEMLKACMDDSHKLELLIYDGLDLEELRYTGRGEVFGKLLKDREMHLTTKADDSWGDVTGLFTVLDSNGISLDGLADDWSLAEQVGFLRQPPPASLISLLTEHGIDVNAYDRQGQTLLVGMLHYQEEADYMVPLAGEYVAAGVDPLLGDGNGFNAVHYALINGDPELAIQMLGEREPDLATLAVLGTLDQFRDAAENAVVVNRDLEKRRGLHLAAGADHGRFRELYEAGFVPELCSLIINGDEELLRDALARENYSQDAETFGSLFYTKQFAENDELLRILLGDRTYMQNVDMSYFAYAMFTAIADRKPQRLRMLLNAGVPIVPEDEMMRRGTPLMCMAVSYRDEEMLELLFEHGADPNVGLELDPATGMLTGDPPLMHLAGIPEVLDYDKNRRIYERLLAEGARLDFLASSMTGRGPEPPLWDLCRSLNADALRLLLDNGLDPGQMPPPLPAGQTGLPPGVPQGRFIMSSQFGGVLSSLAAMEGMDSGLFSMFAMHATDADLTSAISSCIRDGNPQFISELVNWYDAPPSAADQKLLVQECFVSADLQALDSLLRSEFAIPDYNTGLQAMLSRLR